MNIIREEFHVEFTGYEIGFQLLPHPLPPSLPHSLPQVLETRNVITNAICV